MLLSYLEAERFCFVGPELTVPIEVRIAFWNKKKTAKHEKMTADHGSPSWKLKCIVAEVGCWGYIPPSFRKTLQLFGFTLKELKALVDECSLVSSIYSGLMPILGYCHEPPRSTVVVGHRGRPVRSTVVVLLPSSQKNACRHGRFFGRFIDARPATSYSL